MTARQVRAACIGECMVELRPVEGGLYARGFAGDAYNTAVYLARSLGDGGEVAFVTTVGDDAMSTAMKAEFACQGLSTAEVFVAAGRAPGLYMIELDARGDRSFLYWRGQSAARGWMASLAAAGGAERLAGFDLVYLSGISLAILPPQDRQAALDLMDELRSRGVRVAFDPNLRLRLWENLATARKAIEAAARRSAILLPSQQDGELLWDVNDPDEQIERWAALCSGEAALTLAEAGALVADPQGGRHTIPAAPPERVIDTSGAGDSFNGGYLAARLQGASPEDAARAGVRLAARVVGVRGAILP